ncbi:MAG: exopolysaccharide biosynthesis protein [Pseudomonadota bacterium]
MNAHTMIDEKTDEAPRGALAKIEAVLAAKAQTGTHITLGDLSDALGERAYGLMLLILSLPCCLPFVYILPQIVALPMAVLAWQMAVGRRAPWLPEKLRNREIEIETMLGVVARAKRYGGWLEKLAHPRFAGVTGRLGSRIVGALMVVPALSVLVPLPLTNTVPGFGIALASVGLIERDGLFTIAGLLAGFIWVALLVIGGPALIYFIVDFLTA